MAAMSAWGVGRLVGTSVQAPAADAGGVLPRGFLRRGIPGAAALPTSLAGATWGGVRPGVALWAKGKKGKKGKKGRGGGPGTEDVGPTLGEWDGMVLAMHDTLWERSERLWAQTQEMHAEERAAWNAERTRLLDEVADLRRQLGAQGWAERYRQGQQQQQVQQEAPHSVSQVAPTLSGTASGLGLPEPAAPTSGLQGMQKFAEELIGSMGGTTIHQEIKASSVAAPAAPVPSSTAQAPAPGSGSVLSKLRAKGKELDAARAQVSLSPSPPAPTPAPVRAVPPTPPSKVSQGEGSWPTLSVGDDDVYYVGLLHQALEANGFYPPEEEVDDIMFQEGTQEAILSWQACNGLQETGFVGPAEWAKLGQGDVPPAGAPVFGANAGEALLFPSPEPPAAAAPPPPVEDAVEEECNVHDKAAYAAFIASLDESLVEERPMLRFEAGGRDVHELHKALMANGCFPGEDDCEFWQFGDATDNAVRVFQSMEGLPETGIVEAKVWKALMGTSLREIGENSRPSCGEYGEDRAAYDEDRVWLMSEGRFARKM